MKKRSVKIFDHETSVSLEDEFWEVLQLIANERNLTMNGLITLIDDKRKNQNLSSALRIHVLKYLQENSNKKSAD
jgi:predicted DNA-binding ribbon-helix-helix protein